ncbi:Putative odorant receptor 92a [Anthophora quadrimaculata]
MIEEIEENLNYRNVNYKLDIEYAIRVAKILLTPIGIWPRSDSHNNVRLFAQTAIVFVLMCFLLIPHVIYTYFDCEDLTRYMKVIAAQVFSLLAIIKFWTVIINKKEIRFCLLKMEMQYENIDSEEDRLVMTNCAKIGRFFTALYLGLCYGGALPYHIILPLISERIVMENNTTRLPLPYLSNYVFFLIEDSPIYEIIFFSQMVISTIILSTNCGIYSLVVTIIMHCCGLFEVTNRRMESISMSDRKNIRNSLRNIVQFHLKAVEFAEMIEKALNVVFLSEMLGCTVIICFLEYGVIVEWADNKTFSTMTYFVLMTAIFANVFILSFIGDRLKQVSERIGETTYFLPWYDLPDDVAKNIRTIILRASRPSNLSGAKLFDITLQAFCDVCKTSAAYFNFLRAMTT